MRLINWKLTRLCLSLPENYFYSLLLMSVKIMETMNTGWCDICNIYRVLNIFLHRVDQLLCEYEVRLSEAMTAGINITSQDFKINWDYLQSVFFSTTILTTIGMVCHLSIIHNI